MAGGEIPYTRRLLDYDRGVAVAFLNGKLDDRDASQVHRT